MSASAAASAKPPPRLPALRPELQVLPGAPDASGEPAWLIHDPLTNGFIHIGVAAYEALRHWPDTLVRADLLDAMARDGVVAIDEAGLEQLVGFLHANQLTEAPITGAWRTFARQHEARQHSLVGFLVHNYLFFRLPLWQPQAFLERTLPWVRFLWSNVALTAIWLMGLSGAYLVSRRWDEFVSTAIGFFTWEGVLLTGAVILLLKAAHELGHAYTAVRFGSRVHAMGVAFVVMAPLLYTDVTDSWRLTNRHHRLKIDGAGIWTEMAIAAIALFAWSFMPVGPLRSAAFLVCAVSVVSSLAVNLNPFMRFDGYYLLSETLGIENLQSRAFAIGRWRLREILFGLGAPCPEPLSGRMVTVLTVYAWAVWVYRVTLFVGIALLVYHYFFKVLGLILFAVEIIFFVARPVLSELTVWWSLRARIMTQPRFKLTALVCFVAIAGVLLPWSSRIEIPAVLEAARLQQVYPVRMARIAVVHVVQGSTVRAGDPIATLESPDIERQLEQARISLAGAQLQYNRRMADAADREGSLILESTIHALQSRIAGLEAETEDLRIKAPFAGVIAELNADCKPGRWISEKEQIAIVADTSAMAVAGYVAEQDWDRIKAGSHGLFIPETIARGDVKVAITELSAAAVPALEISDLASVYGGRITVNADEKRRLVPSSAQYRVRADVLQPVADRGLSVRGVVVAEGRARSLLARVWTQAIQVLIRESGA